ncbi:hypothetical protein E2C01_090774 [Portunus trituberculatus]|uniref:Uncharacterized protein n=1 Tax=Portunus trituberculatus TaxID=210409 RepID=A0A5B7JR16_PORTR|nr:hypothetical protein [Portunus trituberculatus]
MNFTTWVCADLLDDGQDLSVAGACGEWRVVMVRVGTQTKLEDKRLQITSQNTTQPFQATRSPSQPSQHLIPSLPSSPSP